MKIIKTVRRCLYPTTNIFTSLRRQDLSWRDVLGELIDNALDSGADRIEIEIGNDKYLSISDNGNGIKSIDSLLILGQGESGEHTELGRYGIGFKDAACWLWGTASIVTRTSQRGWKTFLDWNRIVHAKDWYFDETEIELEGVRRGTSIKFNYSQERRFRDFKRLISDIGFVYSPCLSTKHGKRRNIIFTLPNGNKLPCEPYTSPPLQKESIVHEEFEINGKHVHLKMGIVVDGERNDRPGLIYEYAYRTIPDCSTLGLGEFSPSRIFGVVRLRKGEWDLAKNKNAISDDDKDRLEDAIYARCKPVLESMKRRGHEVAIDRLSRDIESRIDMSRILTGKERRDPGTQTGTVVPIRSGIKRTHATKIDGDGQAQSKQAPYSRLRIEYYTGHPDELGRAELFPRKISVMLNEAHPFMGKLQAEAMLTGVNDAIISIALAIISHQYFKMKAQTGSLPFMYEWPDFLSMYASVLSGVKSTEAATIKQASGDKGASS